MNLETIFEKFELFAEAPGAVARMRELVMNLAVNGKLVEQKPTELSALECIQQANLPLIQIEVKSSIETPSGWIALPLGCLIASNTGGGTPSKSIPEYWNGPIPWASVKDVQSNKYLRTTIDSITEVGLRNSSSNLIPSNRLLVVTRMGLGKLAINSIPVAINQDLRAIEPTSALDLDFAYLLFKSLKMVGTGVTVQGITIDKLHTMTVKAPPLAEQKRIVAKVNELMALCDQLEVQQQERETRKRTLSIASLARFAKVPSPANLNFIFHNSYEISPADLRKAILTLAVQGKLVPQDPKDELASTLFGRIQNERKKYAELMRLRIHDESAMALPQYKLPTQWKWTHLEDLFYVMTDGDHLPPPKSEEGIAFLTIGNITTGKIDFTDCRFVPPSYFDALAPFRKPSPGDILYTAVGATYGRPALVKSNRPFCVQRHIAILKPAGSVNPEYLLLVLKSPLVYNQASASTTGTAQPTIPLGSLRRFNAPLPPLAEQHRIVAKVDQLMALVDQLEAQITSSRTTAEKLLQALVAELSAAEKVEPKVLTFPQKVEKEKGPTKEFIEALVIAELVRKLAKPEYPLGNFRRQKIGYFAHRKASHDVVEEYRKMAAGPYNPWTEHGGPKKIALKNGYVQPGKFGDREGLVPGPNIDQIDRYLDIELILPALDWAIETFRYAKNEKLELLATVDYASEELRQTQRPVTVQEIRKLIAANEKWAPKLDRSLFSEDNVKRALEELGSLLPFFFSRATA